VYMVGTNDMRKFAELVQALSALSKIRTLVDMLFGAFDASLTVAKHSKVMKVRKLSWTYGGRSGNE
jgi:hypothetical protein